MTSYDSTQHCGRPRIARGVGRAGGALAGLLGWRGARGFCRGGGFFLWRSFAGPAFSSGLFSFWGELVSSRISFCVWVFSWPCGESIIRAWARQLGRGLVATSKGLTSRAYRTVEDTEKAILAKVGRG